MTDSAHRLFSGIDAAFFGDDRPRRLRVTQWGPQTPNTDRIYGRFEELWENMWTAKVSESGQPDLRNTLEGMSMRLLDRELASVTVATNPKVAERIGQSWSILLNRFPQLSFYAKPDQGRVTSGIVMYTHGLNPDPGSLHSEVPICYATGSNLYESLQRLDAVEIPGEFIELALGGSAYRGAEKAIQRSFERLKQ